MADSGLKPHDLIWKRINDHGDEISRLRADTATQKVRLDALEKRTDKLLDTVSAARSEAQASYAQLHRSISHLDSQIQQARGGIRVAVWVLGVLGTAIGLAVTVFLKV